MTSDPRRLERIVANLVGNALEHGGSTVVGSGRRATTIEVADDGPGIPPEHLPHVFERFYKADAVAQRRAARASASRSRRRTRGCSAARSRSTASRVAGSRFTLRL